MEHFGQDILALILNYRKEMNMSIPSNAQEELGLAGLDTKQVSLALFKQGMSPAEIANKRNLATSTIESHLAHWVNLGKLDVFELIDKNKYNRISKCLTGADIESISRVKEMLGEEFSYGEIRLVMANEKRQAVL